MRVTIVGCSGSMARPGSPASSYLVQADDADGRTWNLVLDLGNGAFGALQSVIDPTYVDGVAITHLHPDHYADLCSLYVYLRYHPERGEIATGACAPVPVRGPQGTGPRVATAFGLAEGEELCCFDVETWQEVWSAEGPTPPRLWHLGPLTVEAVPVEHPVPAYSLRVTGPSDVHDGEATFVYSGDTDVCDGILEAARDADLLLVEAAFQEGRDLTRGIHLTGRRAGEVATLAGASRAVLTHLQPWTDPEVILAEATAAFSGPVDLAAPGAVYRV